MPGFKFLVFAIIVVPIANARPVCRCLEAKESSWYHKIVWNGVHGVLHYVPLSGIQEHTWSEVDQREFKWENLGWRGLYPTPQGASNIFLLLLVFVCELYHYLKFRGLLRRYGRPHVETETRERIHITVTDLRAGTEVEEAVTPQLSGHSDDWRAIEEVAWDHAHQGNAKGSPIFSLPQGRNYSYRGVSKDFDSILFGCPTSFKSMTKHLYVPPRRRYKASLFKELTHDGSSTSNESMGDLSYDFLSPFASLNFDTSDSSENSTSKENLITKWKLKNRKRPKSSSRIRRSRPFIIKSSLLKKRRPKVLRISQSVTNTIKSYFQELAAENNPFREIKPIKDPGSNSVEVPIKESELEEGICSLEELEEQTSQETNFYSVSDLEVPEEKLERSISTETWKTTFTSLLEDSPDNEEGNTLRTNPTVDNEEDVCTPPPESSLSRIASLESAIPILEKRPESPSECSTFREHSSKKNNEKPDTCTSSQPDSVPPLETSQTFDKSQDQKVPSEKCLMQEASYVSKAHRRRRRSPSAKQEVKGQISIDLPPIRPGILTTSKSAPKESWSPKVRLQTLFCGRGFEPERTFKERDGRRQHAQRPQIKRTPETIQIGGSKVSKTSKTRLAVVPGKQTRPLKAVRSREKIRLERTPSTEMARTRMKRQSTHPPPNQGPCCPSNNRLREEVQTEGRRKSVDHGGSKLASVPVKRPTLSLFSLGKKETSGEFQRSGSTRDKFAHSQSEMNSTPQWKISTTTVLP